MYKQTEQATNIAMQMYAKVQSIQLSGVHTLDADSISEAALLDTDESRDVVRAELAKLKVSLDDSSSPSVSVIKDLHRQGLLGLDDSHIGQLVNASPEMLIDATDKLERIYSELEAKEQVMVSLQSAYDRKISELALSQTADKDFSRDKDAKVQELLEKDIFEAYIEYQRGLLKATDAEVDGVHLDYSDQHKVDFVRRVFGVMEPKQIGNFGTDLLQFGIAHDVPDAVRIGENLAGLNGEDVPADVVSRLKEYTLSHSDKLRERIQATGPMRSVVQTRRASLLSKQDREAYIPSNVDELANKYSDKYNSWRLPSPLARDHSKRGILDAALGKDRLDRLDKFLKF